VLVYNGDVDMACNFLGDEWFVEALNLPVRLLHLLYEPHHDKPNIMGLRPAWIQTSLRIYSVTNRGTDSEQYGSWSDCADAQAGLNPCWSQTHYVGFVMTRLISSFSLWFLWLHIHGIIKSYVLFIHFKVRQFFANFL
jgi:hypothetical protein